MLPRAGLLVNTTSLGMKGQPPLAVDVAQLPAGATVADLIYVPLETELLKAARMRGLQTADGLGMLLHQAAPAFEAFFGVRPQVSNELRRAVEAVRVRGLQVTVSLGVAGLKPGEDLQQLLSRADGALYASKRGGRNRSTLAA